MLFFQDNGLNAAAQPQWGGWGGRFVSENGFLYCDSPDEVFDHPTPPISYLRLVIGVE